MVRNAMKSVFDLLFTLETLLIAWNKFLIFLSQGVGKVGDLSGTSTAFIIIIIHAKIRGTLSLSTHLETSTWAPRALSSLLILHIETQVNPWPCLFTFEQINVYLTVCFTCYQHSRSLTILSCLKAKDKTSLCLHYGAMFNSFHRLPLLH